MRVVTVTLCLAASSYAGDLNLNGNLNTTGTVSAVAINLGGDTRTNWPGSGAVDLTEPIIDFSQPAQFYRYTLTNDTTWAFTNHVAGRVVWLRLLQDSSGGWNATWPDGVLWPESGAPTAGGANSLSVYKFVDDGTYWLGQVEAANYQAPCTTCDYALQFGSSSYVTMGSGSAFYPQAALTLEFWFKSADTFNGQFWVAGNWPGMLIQIYGANVQFGIQSQNSQHWTSSSNVNVLDGAWHHIAGVWTGTQLLCFVDGTQVGSASWSSPPDVGSADLRVGKQANLNAYWSSITVDLVRLSNTARYSYNQDFSGSLPQDFTSDSNTVGLWKFNEGSGTTAADSSANARNGTLSGNSLPTWVSGVTGGNQQNSMMRMGGSSLSQQFNTFNATLNTTNEFSAPVSLTLMPPGQ